DVIVAEHACRNQGRTDHVRTAGHRLTARAAVGGCHAVACEEANKCAGKGWINLTIGLTCWVWCYRSIFLLDRELCGVVGNVVVTEHTCRSQGSADRVRTARYSFTGSAHIRGCDAISCEKATKCAGKGWISTAIGLIGRVRRNRGVLLLDREVSGVIGDVVIAEDTCRSQGSADRVRTTRYSFTGNARIRGRDAIDCDEANKCASKSRISTAISLASYVRRYRSILLLDGEVCRVVGDVVVAESTCRSQDGVDFVRTAAYGLTDSAAIGRTYAINGEEANERASKCRIGAAIHLDRGIG